MSLIYGVGGSSDKLFCVLDIYIPAFGMSSPIPWGKKETIRIWNH